MTLAAGILVLLAVVAWASGRVPEHLVALAFFTVAVLLHVAPPAVVFSGFTSGAIWLIFGGQVMGVGIRHTGLARRIADSSARRLGSRSYASVVAGTVALGTVLSFLLPSAMGRVALLMPIAGALADRYGFREPCNGRTGILLAAGFGTTVPAMAILPASVPNAVLAGAAESYHHVTLGYVEYLVLHFPVLGVVRGAVLAVLVARMFPDTLRLRDGATPDPAPLSRREWAVVGLVGAALALWATDSIHHIPPAWVSLAVALPFLYPPAGLLPPRAFNENINYTSLFFVAGIMGVGAVMAHTGLGDVLGGAVRAVLPLRPGSNALDFASLVAMGTLLGLATTAPGLPAVMTPLASSLAAATGLPLRSVLMSEVLGFSNNLLPYQSPPLVLATHLSAAPMRSASRLSLALFAASTAIVLPIDFLWWRLLGWL